MSFAVSQIIKRLQEKIEAFEPSPIRFCTGEVLEVGDGVARVSGISDVCAQEIVQFENIENSFGMANSLEEDQVGVIILDKGTGIVPGTKVRTTGRILSVPVGDSMIGRVIDALGRPVDEKGSIDIKKYGLLERVAPGVMARYKIDTPLYTGIKVIDTMIPIGCGQRELIIGDRHTGKTSLALDIILNQKNQHVLCIYVAIGQRLGKVAKLVELLKKTGAMDYTTVVVASASDPASMWYIAPYAGCAIGEEFMNQGRNALVVYDDLTKHAWAFRQLSLLLNHPTGREAYPGDIFFAHSRLLERAARLHPDSHGGGSLTALPIIETFQGDMTSYIPTNLISITDGQIYLEMDLFNRGVRPAVNVGASVSRIGGDAQIEAIRKISGGLRTGMASYRELGSFAQFNKDLLDEKAKQQKDYGDHLEEIFKQRQYALMPIEDIVMVTYAGAKGYTDSIPLNQMEEWERGYLAYMKHKHPEIGRSIAKNKLLPKDVEGMLKDAIIEFTTRWQKRMGMEW